MFWVKQKVISTVSLIIFLVMVPTELISKVWARFVKRQGTPITWSLMKEVYAETLCSVDEALHSFMPEADEFRKEKKRISKEQQSVISEKSGVFLHPILDRRFEFYTGIKGGRVIGYAVKDIIKGKWGPIRYMLAFNTDGSIADVIVLEYSERRGRPVAKRRFLKQFFGKSIQDQITLKKDIRSVSGATLSSRSMSKGIKKLVYVFNELYANDLYAYKQ